MDNLDCAEDIEKQVDTIQKHKAYVGMEFDSEDDANFFFLNEYARKTGFCNIKAPTYKFAKKFNGHNTFILFFAWRDF